MILVVAGLVVAFNGRHDDTLDAANTDTTQTTAGDSGFVLPSTLCPTSTTTSTTTRSRGDGSPTTTTSTTSTTTKSTAADTEVKEQKCISTTDSPPAVDPDWQSYWTSQPEPNYPVEILICVDDWKPKVGQPITLSIRARDADMKISQGGCDISVTWDGPPATCREDVNVEAKRAPDPHQVDSKTRNQVTLERKNAYDGSGEHTIVVRVWSGPADKRSTYESFNSIELAIEVHK